MPLSLGPIPRGLGLALSLACSGVGAGVGAASAMAGDVVRVGPGEAYGRIGEAARAAGDGATVEIRSGTYSGDVAVWTQNDLTVRAVGGPVIVKAAGAHAEGKAIWVVRGNRVTIEGIEFVGARVPDGNGAGLRGEGLDLTVRRCAFRDNQNGILVANDLDGDVVVDGSVFDGNGAGDGRTHNLYVGRVRGLTVRHSYLHHARGGHQLKSRARFNRIEYNRIEDGPGGNGGMAIDLPEGGLAVVLGNVLGQDPASTNATMVGYGAESPDAPSRLFVVHNTFVNRRHAGTFVYNHTAKPARLYNNLLVGPGRVVAGPAIAAGNLAVREFGWLDRVRNLVSDGSQVFDGVLDGGGNRATSGDVLVDPASGDFRPRPGSAAVDAAAPEDGASALDLEPVEEYVHPAAGRRRPHHGVPDIGAFESGSG